MTAAPSSTTATAAAAFNSGFRMVTAQLKQSSAAIGSAIQRASSQTNAQLAATFGDLATRWAGETSELTALTPPAAVSADFGTLMSAATRVEHDLVAVSAAASKNDVPAAKSGVTAAARDVLTAKAAATKIDLSLGIK